FTIRLEANGARLTPAKGTFFVDNTPPVATLSYSKSTALVGVGPLVITAAFSEAQALSPLLSIDRPGTGGDVLEAPMIPNPADPSVWTFTHDVLSGSPDGLATVTLTDAAGNAATGLVNRTFTVDATPPQVALSYSKNPLALGSGALEITATFNEAVVTVPTLAIVRAGGGANDLAATAMTATADPLVWTATYTVLAQNGSTILDGIAQCTVAGGLDAAGNANAPATNSQFTVDTTPPVVTLAHGGPTTNVGTGPRALTVTLDTTQVLTPVISIDRPGTDNDVSGVALTPTTHPLVWTHIYTVAAANGTTILDGQASITVADGVGNVAAPFANDTFTVDTTPPAVSLSYSKTTSGVSAGRLDVTVSFNEPLVTNPTLAIVRATGGGNDLAVTQLTPTVNPLVWLASWDVLTQNGSTILDGQATVTIAGGLDAAGNANAVASNRIVTVDTTAPNAVLSYSQNRDLVKAGALTISATFNEAIVLAPSIGIVRATGGGNDVVGATMSPTADPTVWTYVYTVLTNNGTTILDGAAIVTVSGGRDVAGNANAPATNTSFSIDTSQPTVSLSFSKNQAAVGTGALLMTATFSEALVSGPSLALDRPGAAGDVAATPMTATADPAIWTFTHTVAAADATTILDGLTTVTISGGLDASGNENLAAANNTFTIDTTPPSVVLAYSRSASGVPTGTLLISATFGEDLVTVPSLAVDRPGTGNDVAATVMTTTADARVFTLAYVVAANDGTTVLDGLTTATVSGAQDAAGNSNAPATNATFTVDTTRPDVALEYSRPSSAVPTGPLIITARFSEALATLPSIAVDRPGTGDDTALKPMSPSTDPAVFTYTYLIVRQNASTLLDGLTVAAVSGAADAAGNSATAATNASFTIVTNARPVARATAPPSNFAERVMTVDARASSDADGDTLVYHWRLASAPTEVTTIDFNPNGTSAAASATFTPLVTGTYRVEVVASDGLSVSETSSAQFEVTSSPGLPPVAEAGAALSGSVTAPVQLDGTGSTDDKGWVITYRWSFVSVPAGSLLTAGSIAPNDSPAAGRPAFTADRKGTYVVRLIVSDGPQDSPEDTVQVEIGNTAPVAAIAAPNAVAIGTPMTLDGRGSSDANAAEDTLTYRWSFISVPAGSRMVTALISPNNSPSATQPSFTPDVVGIYTIGLVVDDGTASSVRAQAVAQATAGASQPPVADVLVSLRQGGPRLIELDGSGSSASSPPAGNRIVTYAWNLIQRPAKATAFSAATALVRYEARAEGTYQFTLTVTDQAGLTSTVLETIVVDDVGPHAQLEDDLVINLPRAGTPAGLATTAIVLLDGRLSGDANDDAITYRWSVLSAPVATSGLIPLEDLTRPTAHLNFPTDLDQTNTFLRGAGRYVVQLTVSDGDEQESESLEILALDPLTLLPWADSGVDATYLVRFLSPGVIAATVPDPTVVTTTPVFRDFVRLDGHESADPRARTLTYRWQLARDDLGNPLVPAGAQVPVLTNAGTATPSFVPGLEGEYTFELIVNNGAFDSRPDRVTVTIHSAETQNHRPHAEVLVEDLAKADPRGPLDAVRSFAVGDWVELNGAGSSDRDSSDRANGLLYTWRQTAGESVALTPSPTAAVARFLAPSAGRYSFELTVADRRGARSEAREIACVVLAPAQSLPRLRLVASASTVSTTGEDAGDGLTEGSRNSLRVLVSSTVTPVVTLTATVDAASRYRLRWAQVDGPTVVLTSGGEDDTTASVTRTAFAPTTSRVHEFEAVLTLLDASGADTGVSVSRRIRVLVDTPESRVPIANVVRIVQPAPLDGTDAERRIVLDGRGSAPSGTLPAGRQLSYVWEQLAGPQVELENPFSALTAFTAPRLDDNVARRFVFALYVDTGADRSEPFIVTAAQQGLATVASQYVALYLDGQPICASAAVQADNTALLTNIVIPIGTAEDTNLTLTLERVNGDGPQRTRLAVLRTYTFQLNAAASTTLNLASDNVSVNPAVRGVPLSASVSLPVQAANPGVDAGGAGGGGGCTLRQANEPAGSDGLLLGLAFLALAARSRRRRTVLD
ncbi:MAG: hypothetical protein HY816_23200, partial [Candidatus Wallbacteria bacterium]|nr:hypothetical protein [Candidatus Wallbacteria bacterium]